MHAPLTYPRNEKDFISMAGFLSLLQLRMSGCEVQKDKTKDLEKTVEAYMTDQPFVILLGGEIC